MHFLTANTFGIFLLCTLSLVACGGGTNKSISHSSAATTSTSSTSSTSSLSSSSLSSAAHSANNSSSSSVQPIQSLSIDAGQDIYAVSGNQITLSAKLRNNTLNDVRYTWNQLTGPKVSLNQQANLAVFTAPTVTTPTELLFEVLAEQSQRQGKDYLRIIINNKSSIHRFEAESAFLDNLQSANQVSGFSGSGYVQGFTSESGLIIWSHAIPSGNYRIHIGYRAEERKGYELTINGESRQGFFEPSTGFNDVKAGRIFLPTGQTTISLGKGWGWYEIDYLELIPIPPAPTPLLIAPKAVTGHNLAQGLVDLLASHYGAGTLSGQQDLEGNEYVYAITGKIPAIYSFDLLNYSPMTLLAGNNPKGQIEDFIKTINDQKQIASLLWHWHSPMHAKSTANPCPTGNSSCWWNSFYSEHTHFNLQDALADQSSAEYLALLNDIDAIAVQLKKLQQENIPVLWRPLHEADGGWFWWGASGDKAFIELWRLMYERLTHDHQLTNLVWVWTNETMTWYPGDDVVDIVSIDAYPSNKYDLLTTGWDNLFERFDGHKLIALTEFGGVPFIKEMQAQGIWWSYFASWTDQQALLGPRKMTNNELNIIYSADSVINLDDLRQP